MGPCLRLRLLLLASRLLDVVSARRRDLIHARLAAAFIAVIGDALSGAMEQAESVSSVGTHFQATLGNLGRIGVGARGVDPADFDRGPDREIDDLDFIDLLTWRLSRVPNGG